METVQVALLARDSVKMPGFSCSKTATITANGQVGFVFGPDNSYSLRFSLDQWNEIVQFVFNQIAPPEVEEKQPSWEPDWSKIPSDFFYFGISACGRIDVFESYPQRRKWQWARLYGKVLEIGHIDMPQGLDWKDTLRIRPRTVSPKHHNCSCG